MVEHVNINEQSEQVSIIETTPGAAGLFAPAEAQDDYAAWVRDRFERAQVKTEGQTIYMGLAQQINAMTYQARHGGLRLLVAGRYAHEAAEFLLEASKGTLRPEVLEVGVDRGPEV